MKVSSSAEGRGLQSNALTLAQRLLPEAAPVQLKVEVVDVVSQARMYDRLSTVATFSSLKIFLVGDERLFVL